MNSDKINEIEDTGYAEVIENTDTEPVLTEEEKKEQEKMFRGMFARRWKWALQHIYDRMKRYNKTIDDLKKEIEAKISPFSVSERILIMSFESDFLDQCITDLFKGPRAL